MENNEVFNGVFEAQELSLGYGSRNVLEGVNFLIEPGAFWFFLGPNGHGKTTLLKGLLGTLVPTKGQLKTNAHFVKHEFIGFIPQRWEIGRHIPTTVREFVELGLVGLALNHNEKSERLESVLNQVGLSTKERTNFWDLSGGQRQRALVARALIRKPKVLFADEPTNGLDLKTESDLLNSLQKLNQEDGLTIVFVTHNLPLAMRYATHVALFQSGHVLSGPCQEVLKPAHLEETYGIKINLEEHA